MSVESTFGEGARFHLEFPVQIEPRSAVATTASPEAPAATGETVLVVEDEPQVRLFVERVLTRAGYQVHTAEDGKEALEMLERGQSNPALALIDLGLPKMTGADLAHHLQARFPCLPLLVTSGRTGWPQEERTQTRFLPKPFSPKLLLQMVHSLLHPGEPASSPALEPALED